MLMRLLDFEKHMLEKRFLKHVNETVGFWDVILFAMT